MTKPKGQKPTPYPFKLLDIPISERTRMFFNAESTAVLAILEMEENPRTRELFWVTFYFEYRVAVEKWVKDHADQ